MKVLKKYVIPIPYKSYWGDTYCDLHQIRYIPENYWDEQLEISKNTTESNVRSRILIKIDEG